MTASAPYEQYGNRWHQAGPNPMTLSFTGNNNRMDGYFYDAAGNLLNDGAHNYYFDAESRIVQVDGPTLGACSTATACYVYDASGQRVRKTTGGTSVDYLYDLASHEMIELSSTGAMNRGEVYAGNRHVATYELGTTYLNFSDWLGTERLRTLATGVTCETITSLPFGDGQNTSGSCADSSPMHLTGKQRDAESGLDNFGARYDSSQYGRFMTPDPLLNSGRPWDPQTWNRYAYARNNPVNFVDPTGLYEWAQNCASDDQKCQANRQRFRDALEKIKEAANKLENGSKDREKLDKILKKYGAEGEKNKVQIEFGDAGGALAKEHTSFFSRTKTVTFDLDYHDRTYGNRNDGSDSAIEFAGTVAHEGAHMLDSFIMGDPRNYQETLGTERNAYDAQSFINRAYNTYSPDGIWNPSWAAADRETLRSAGVEKAAKRDADITWGKQKENH